MSLVSRIAEAIATDDNDQSERLEHTYYVATPEQKQAIDDAMICLCGWSLATMIAGSAEEEDANG